jgi:hypothetical protein
MAMNAGALKNEIVAALQAEFGTDYENIPDDENLPGFDQTTFWNRYWGACATAIVAHIQANARAIGAEPPMHTNHNLPIF